MCTPTERTNVFILRLTKLSLLLLLLVPSSAEAVSLPPKPYFQVGIAGCGSPNVECYCWDVQGSWYRVPSGVASLLSNIAQSWPVHFYFSTSEYYFYFLDAGTILCPAIGVVSHITNAQQRLNRTSSSWASVLQLTSLQVLDLSNLGLVGTIPDFRALTQLKFLDLSDNYLSGTIPTTLGQVPSLSNIDLSNNNFAGSIPDTLTSKINLACLGLTNNQINGTISPSFGSLSNLLYLGLSHNSLVGELPIEITSSSSIEYLGLAHNQLNGSLPSNLTHVPSLSLNSGISCISDESVCPGMYENVLFDRATASYSGESSLCSGLALNDNLFSGPLPDLEQIPSPFPILLHNNNLKLVSSSPPIQGPKLNYALADLCEARLITLSPQNVSEVPHVSCFGNCAVGRCFPGYWGSAVFLNLSDIGSCSSASSISKRSMAEEEEEMLLVGTKFGCDSSIQPPTDVGAPTTCPPSSLPQPPFFCSSTGQWVSNIDVTAPLVVLPADSSVLVHGDLSVTTLTISGLNSSVAVDGCLKVNGSFVVVLDKEDLDKIKVNGGKFSSVISRGSCWTQSIPVAVSTDSRSCETISASTQTSLTAISVLFELSEQSCEKTKSKVAWWIILVSVIGGVLIIIAILAILSLYNSKLKSMVRPFTKRSQTSE